MKQRIVFFPDWTHESENLTLYLHGVRMEFPIPMKEIDTTKRVALVVEYIERKLDAQT